MSASGARRDVPDPDATTSTHNSHNSHTSHNTHTSVARLTSLARRASQREEVRYLVVAGTTALCYLGLLAGLLLAGFQYMIAILIDQVIVFSVAFPVYRVVIFRSTGGWRSDLVRFAGVWSGGFIAGIFATPALVEIAGLPPLLAQVIAVAVVAAMTFLGHKFVSFRR